MFKKSRVFALSLCCALASMTAMSCSDDSGKSSEETTVQYMIGVVPNVPDDQKSCATESMCSVTLEQGQSVAITVSVAKKSDKWTLVQEPVNVTVSSPASMITVQNTGTTATVSTMNGSAIVYLTAGSVAGTENVTFVTDDAHGSAKGYVSVTIKAKNNQDIEPPKDVCETFSCNDETSPNYSYGNCVFYHCIDAKESDTYSATIKYSGKASVISAQAFLVPDTCAHIIGSAQLDSEQINDLYKDGYQSLGFAYNQSGIDGSVISNTLQTLNTSYAVVAIGTNGASYNAYGCTDGMSSSKKSVIVTLNDAKGGIINPIETCESLNCPAELTSVSDNNKYAKCISKGCVDPFVPAGKYTGTFDLMSQFNALSLLPRADVPAGKKPQFDEMLVGDWIEWSLDLLKDPATAVPSILVNQVLPLILNADWLTSMLAKIGLPDYILSMLSPEFIATLLESMNLTQLVTDYINEFLNQYSWWSPTSSAIKILDEVTTNFTMAGYIYVTAEPGTDHKTGMTNIHSYDTLLYNMAGFDKCYVGNEYGRDKSGGLICGIPLGEVDKNIGTIRGTFSSEYVNCTGDSCTAVNIDEHNVSFAYGTIVYSTIMYMLPLIIGDNVSDVKSFGGLIEYYAGYLLVKAWNSVIEKANAEAIAFNTENAEAIAAGTVSSKTIRTDTIDETKVTKCTAVGTAGANFINYLISEKLGWAAAETILKTWVNASTLAPLCSLGVSKLDGLINEQIAKLEASTDAITFETAESCNLKINSSKDIVSYGPENFTWGQKTDDDRCKWNLNIASKPIEGKFFAVRNDD